MSEPWPVLLMARELALGGSERQLCEFAKAMDRSRFEPHVACFRGDGFRGDELRAAGVPILELPVGSFLSPSALAGARRLGRYLDRHRIRIVHAFDLPLTIFGVPVARAFRTPLVLSSQRSHRDLAPGLRRHMRRLADFVVDGLVVNCLSVARQLVAEEHVPAGLIHLCYNGVDVTRFYPGERCWPPALQGASLVIGTLCAFRKEKALPTLLEAFARVRSLRPHLKLLLVGDGPLRKDLQERSARLGLAEDCHFEPATADVARWFHATDIFVLPSVSEALSNSLMEAMACGCCAVASRVGGNPELVTHERTGLLFTAGDVAGLAACLQRLIEQPGLAQELAAAGAAHLRERFSTQVAARRMEEIYTGLIGSADAGRQLI